tara:strand:- start:1437 stop:2078 length:642 start_codon:yes stop_codon:yes gene_type:complete
MIKQNINIVDMPILYNILEEIKNNLSFKIANYTKLNDFEKFLNKNKVLNNILIISKFENKNFFIKKKIKLNNIFFLDNKNINIKDIENYNIIKYPLNIYSLIEKINIYLIKNEYNFQSDIKVKNYSINLNSKTISKEDNKLKLTEREIEIIIFLKDSIKPQTINDLQNKVWGYSTELETHTVETHIYRLRKKINDNFKDNNFLVSTNKGYFIE